MKDKIEQIKKLLSEIENSTLESDDQAFMHNFDALEIPDIIANIVDYLQPNLSTYESAIYWHLFRNSVLRSGQQYLRASVRGLRKGVVMSSSGQSDDLSYAAVQKALQALEDKGAILKAGDTTREGTLYKVFLPEEMSLCQPLMKDSKTQAVEIIDKKKELDYYNVRENRLKVYERDDYKCHYCGKQLTRFTATLDHIQPVSKGGDNSFDNLTTACLHCNSRRGCRPVMDIISEQNGS